MEKDKMWFFFQFLHEIEGSISPEAEKQVMIEKAINLRLMCDYVVSCSYGDVVLIISMLHDYDKELEKCRKKQMKEGRNNDIGEDGFMQLAKKRK